MRLIEWDQLEIGKTYVLQHMWEINFNKFMVGVWLGHSTILQEPYAYYFHISNQNVEVCFDNHSNMFLATSDEYILCYDLMEYCCHYGFISENYSIH